MYKTPKMIGTFAVYVFSDVSQVPTGFVQDHLPHYRARRSTISREYSLLQGHVGWDDYCIVVKSYRLCVCGHFGVAF